MRVIEEAAGGDHWALIGAASCRLQGVGAVSPNLEFMSTDAAVQALAEMLDIPSVWQRGAHLAAKRLHFMRDRVPVFIFANPTFHGSYDALSPLEIPALWDARVRIEIGACGVLATPLEWELLLAVALGADARAESLGQRLRGRCDNRLLTRLLREGHVQRATEEAIWAVVERSA